MTDRTPTDLVVVLPGITGSTLYRDGRPIWKPSAGAILNALFTLGGSLRSLTLPTGLGDEHPGDGVEARELIDDVHAVPGLWTPIKGYGPLVARLESLGYRRPSADSPGNLLEMPYDWRLSNRYTAAWMAPLIERELGRWRDQGGRHADAKVHFACHSMGGLVARRYAAAHGGDHVGEIVTFGTPQRGSMNAVDQLVNGAPGKLGPLRGLVTDLARSLPSLHQLLPSYACVVEPGSTEPVHLDPAKLPGVDTVMASDGLAFHRELEVAEAADARASERLHAILGTNQPTSSTMRLVDGSVELIEGYGEKDYRGDATVPLVAAVPKGVALTSNTLRHVPDNHGNLQRNAAALDELEGILRAEPVVIKGGVQVPLSVSVPELISAGEALQIVVAVDPANRPGLHATVTPAGGARGSGTTQVLRLQDGLARASFEDLAPGAYVVDVTGATAGSPVAPVSAATLVWDSRGQRQ
ncbi:MAG: hypothetical protein IPL45_02695 [Actinomycetales bacterium]|nr:hypothetical protein [Actinomycetales bacterium]